MTRPVVAHDDCQGPLECFPFKTVTQFGLAPPVTKPWGVVQQIRPTHPDDLPMITYARCFACGYAEVTVDYPDGTERRMKVRDGEGMQKGLL